MSGLAETIAKLKRDRNATAQAGGSEGLEEVRGFGANPGSLRMLAYVPQGLTSRAPLVVLLHGCTQKSSSFARSSGWLALADRLGFALLAPEQDLSNNPNRCFNWFEPGDTVRNGGEAASIYAMTQHMVRSHDLDAQRVFITGLSAGGAMTTVLLATYPETYAGGAVVAGLAFGVAGNVSEAFAAMRTGSQLSSAQLGALAARAAPAPSRLPRLSIWQGASDATVAPANAQTLARQWTMLHGIGERAHEVTTLGRRTRSVWRASDGEVAVELNLLEGVGHGVPLSASGDDPLGEVAPFMLEAGVSSSLEIASFWGLASAKDPMQRRVSDDRPAPRRSDLAFGETLTEKVSPYVSKDVRKVIADAFTAAGIMR